MNRDISRQPLLAGINKPVQLGEKVYYIPVVNKNVKYNDISISLLSGTKIVSDEINIGRIPTNFTNITYVKSSEILSFLNDGYIGIILPSQLKDDFKVLSVEGQSYYDKTMDREIYQLFFIEFLK
jgi:hypothetical protein